jgi:hypothetical protein
MSKLNQMPILDPAEFAAIFGEVTGDAVVVAKVRPGMPNEPARTRKSRRHSNLNVEAQVQILGSDRPG